VRSLVIGTIAAGIMHDGWCEKQVAHAASLKLASARTFLTHSLSRPSVSAIWNSSRVEKHALVSATPAKLPTYLRKDADAR
jgi:hypothetical protein